MRSERMCGLARFVISLTDNAAHTHATQWFERTLDDSANRRLSLPEAFLGTEAVLRLASNVSRGMQVWPRVIEKHVQAELPFMVRVSFLSCDALFLTTRRPGHGEHPHGWRGGWWFSSAFA
jgi:adenylosuccinate lyase